VQELQKDQLGKEVKVAYLEIRIVIIRRVGYKVSTQARASGVEYSGITGKVAADCDVLSAESQSSIQVGKRQRTMIIV